MFDIGFWELGIIALVALLVVGPERLPKLAYTAGKWMKKGRSMLSQVKAEIDKEVKAEELREILEKQKKQLNPLEEVVEETSDTLREFSNETSKAAREIGQSNSGAGEASAREASARPDNASK